MFLNPKTKAVTALHLDVPAGLNAHLMFKAHNPPKRGEPVAQVGYWAASDEKGEAGETVWFDVNGDYAKAQAVLDDVVAPELRERAGVPEPEPALAPTVETAEPEGAEAPARRGRPKKDAAE